MNFLLALFGATLGAKCPMVGFGVITLHHGGVKVPGLEEILPTGLPELFQPSRNLNSSGKPELLNPMFYISIRKVRLLNLRFPISPFWGHPGCEVPQF